MKAGVRKTVFGLGATLLRTFEIRRRILQLARVLSDMKLNYANYMARRKAYMMVQRIKSMEVHFMKTMKPVNKYDVDTHLDADAKT